MQTRVVVVRIVRNNAASLVTAGVAGGGSADLCAGGTLLLQASAMRPDPVRRLANATTVPQTYAYLWTVRGDGLNQAQATSPTPDGRLSVVLIGYHQPVELTLFDALGHTVTYQSVAGRYPTNGPYRRRGRSVYAPGTHRC